MIPTLLGSRFIPTSLSCPCFAQVVPKNPLWLPGTHPHPPRGKDFTSLLHTGSPGRQITAKILNQKLCFGAWCEMAKPLGMPLGRVAGGAQLSWSPGGLRAGSCCRLCGWVVSPP